MKKSNLQYGAMTKEPIDLGMQGLADLSLKDKYASLQSGIEVSEGQFLIILLMKSLLGASPSSNGSGHLEES
jgi:hypothetical protein